MNPDTISPALRARAMDCYTESLEKGLLSFQSLIQANPELAEALQEVHQQWSNAQLSEIPPFKGFSFWFPQQIGDYQILNPLSQTFQETLCLARHLPSQRLVGIKLLVPGSGVRPQRMLDSSLKNIDSGRSEGIHYCAFLFERHVIAAYYEPEPLPQPTTLPRKTVRVVAPATGLGSSRWMRKVQVFFQKNFSFRRHPLLTTASLGMVAVIVFLQLTTLPRSEAHSASIESNRETPGGGEKYGEAIRLTQQAIAACKNHERLEAWNSYNQLFERFPKSQGTATLFDHLEKQFGLSRNSPAPPPEEERLPYDEMDKELALLIEGKKAEEASFSAAHR